MKELTEEQQQKLLVGVNEILEFVDNPKEVFQALDDILFDYIDKIIAAPASHPGKYNLGVIFLAKKVRALFLNL